MEQNNIFIDRTRNAGKYILTAILLILISMNPLPVKAEGKVITYPAPSEAVMNRDFTVEVRVKGDARWEEVPSYLVKVDEVKGTAHQVEAASMAYFDFPGKLK